MRPSNSSCTVALPRERNNATDTAGATTSATAIPQKGQKALSLRELRVQLRAQPKRNQVDMESKVGADDTATPARWWLIHYADRDPVEMSCSPPATHAEVMDGHPAALAAEPFEPIPRTPGAPMTPPEEHAVRAWLARIEESDRATIAAVLNVCRADADALAYYLRRAAE